MSGEIFMQELPLQNEQRKKCEVDLFVVEPPLAQSTTDADILNF